MKSTATIKFKITVKPRTPNEIFNTRSLQPVLAALLLITVNGTANAEDDSVEKPTAVAIDAEYLHSLFLMSDGSVWGAGSNLTGALGGEGYVRSTRTPWIIITDVAEVSAGVFHSLFLKKDGSVWAVGHGPLGDGFSYDYEREFHTYDRESGEGVYRVAPVRVMESVEAISAGWAHSLFLKQDGSAWATGENEDGRLGDGTTKDRANTVFVMKDVAAISADFHSLFLKKDGSAWAAGRNDKGQLGDGTMTNRATPVQVMTDVAAISAGRNHSLFLKNDGTVWASGQNDEGRLGDGAAINRSKPVQILTQVAAISAGLNHSLFLKKDGSVWGTGNNGFGQLGDALRDLPQPDRDVTSPVEMMTGVSSLSAGHNYSLFRMADGSVMASGDNMFRCLGFEGPSTPKPTRISFQRRTSAEMKEWKEMKKALDQIPVDPMNQFPIMTKPPRNALNKQTPGSQP